MSKSKVTLIDHMGDDINTPANVARISFNREASEFSDEKNARLCDYLAKHGHWTPFCALQATLSIELNLALHAQLVKHRFGGTINTVSRRYVRDWLEFDSDIDWRYVPDKGVKQGSGNGVDAFTWAEATGAYETAMRTSKEAYEALLDLGIAPEQARFVLPQGLMTKCSATGSIVYFARIYNQRCGKWGHPQKDWAPICDQMNEIFMGIWPKSWKALTGD